MYMTAYNHFIQFVPETEKAENIAEAFFNVITLKESNFLDWQDDVVYKNSFTNNQGRDLALYTDRPFARTVTGQQWAFEVDGVVTFFWSSGEMTIDYVSAQNFTPELLEYWTLHIVLPIFLTIEEHYYFLHAGAVEVGGSPILFVAESFGGKSTMTDYFIKQGYTMVSDDKVGIIEEAEKFLAVPSHPHHRPYRNMEDLGLFVSNMADVPKPISAIYTLHRAASDAPISISKLQGIEKFKALRSSSEINLSFLKSERFKDLGRLAESVPVYKVNVPWDIERLKEVYTAIVDHCRALIK